MVLSLTKGQMDLVIGSLYFANCRLGQFKMGDGKYEEPAKEIIQMINKEKENGTK